jgi:TM2 domain-containing membrane protein YozV
MNESIVKGADEKFCSSCGNAIKKEAEICPKCGVRQFTAPGPNTSGKSRTTAGILALLLGGIGVHKFYLNQPGRGILYALFFWTFIPAIIALIEAIQLFGMTDEKFYQKYA